MLRLARAIFLFKLTVWAAFLFTFPALTFANGMFAGTVVLAVLGLFLDLTELKSLIPEALPRMVRRGVIIAAAVFHVALFIAALTRLVFPRYGAWQSIAGTDGWSSALLARAPEGPIVAVGNAKAHVLGADGRFVPVEGLGDVQVLGASTRRVWVAGLEGRDAWGYDGTSVVHVPLAPGFSDKRGHLQPVEGAALDDALLLLRRGSLVRVDSKGREDIVIPRHVQSVASDGARVIAVGTHLHVSEDGGRSFADRGPLPFKGPRVHAGGGAYYVVQGGLLDSEIHASEGGGPLQMRTSPVRDARDLFVDPRDGRRLWLASWGEGIWTSEDGGRTWQARGLEGLEIHALVARPNGEALAVGANLAVPAGVFRLAAGSDVRR